MNKPMNGHYPAVLCACLLAAAGAHAADDMKKKDDMTMQDPKGRDDMAMKKDAMGMKKEGTPMKKDPMRKDAMSKKDMKQDPAMQK